MSETASGPIDEGHRRAFESRWIEGRPDPIERHLPRPESPSYLATLEELVCIELEFAWKTCAKEVAAGHGSFSDAPRVERYLERFESLRAPEVLGRLAAEEYEIRHRHGDRPPAAEYRERFPQLAPTAGAPGEPPAPPAEGATGDAADRGSAAFAGRYVLMAEHARGGMGAVWRASDRKLGREVALKRLSDALAGRADLRRRFLSEARVTARLEHPGIVPVYDLSAPGDEHDYYAMKLVRGETLATAIDTFHRLDRSAPGRPVEERRLLDAFLTVCRTMEYSHARGVIHRDLKPQNIVLGNYGETIILDWGLAKDTTQAEAPADGGVAGPGTDPSSTLPGTIQGTPAYMAPEQAEGRIADVNERTDVYALGVILYQIVTGKVPFPGADTAEVLERVAEGRPPRPRGIDSHVPRALEAICLTAMARDSAARYASVADLTRDLQRFLADEPVSVWTEPWTVRTRRWMRRHRATVTAAAAAVIVAAIGLGVVALVLAAANRRLEEANRRERAAREEAERERRRAEANFATARDAVDRYFTRVSEDPKLRARGLEHLRKDLLQAARGFYARLAEQKADDPVLELERGHAIIRLAMITDEVEGSARAVGLLEEARDLFRALAGVHPDQAFLRLQIARCENRLGGTLQRVGKHVDAERHFQEGLTLLDGIRKDAPELAAADSCRATTLQNLAGVYLQTGRLDPAEAAYRAAREVQERRVAREPASLWHRYVLAAIRLNLAMVAGRRRAVDAAIEEAEAALALADRLVEAAPQEPIYVAFRAKVQSDLGVCYRGAGRLADARASYEQAVATRDALARAHPDVPAYGYEAAQTRLNLANVLLLEGNAAEAETLFHAVCESAEALAAREPDQPRHVTLLAVAHQNLGALQVRANRPDQAEEHYRKAASLNESLLERDPTAVRRAVEAHRERASLLGRLGRNREAAAEWERICAIVSERLPSEGNGLRGYRLLWAMALAQAGERDRAVALAGEMVSSGDSNALVDAATVHATLVGAVGSDRAIPEPERQAAAERHAAEAVRLLGEAFEAGAFALEQNRKRLDALGPLHSRSDYRALLERIRAGR